MKVTPVGRNINVDFDPVKHKYRHPDGRELHGVTKLAGLVAENGWRIPWSAKMCADVAARQLESHGVDELAIPEIVRAIKGAPFGKSNEAIDFGNAVHAWLESFVLWKIGKGKKPTLPTNAAVKRSVKTFIDWEKENNPTLQGAEAVIYYEDDYDFAGTVDLLFELNGEACVGDFKTAKSIRKREYVFQLGLYALALNQVLDKKITKLFIFGLPKLVDGTWTDFEVLTFPFTDTFADACRNVNHIKHLAVDIDQWLKK